jgi:dTDP-4-amino-4,6-dideoxygalactose transaminase
LIEQKITPRTRAVIAVHLYGQAADLTAIKSICDKHNLFLVEDCAQSHFTAYKEKFVGTIGDAASFSFYPGKNLGAYGDAGAVVTNDDNLARLVRRYANHGSLVKHKHETEGINSRLDGLQAAILSVKLPHLLRWNEKRREHAAYYHELLQDIKEIVCPAERDDTRHTYHLFVLRARKRNELQNFLKEKGIDTQIHYPVPLPFLPAYTYLGHPTKEFPVAAAFQGEILSLPMFPELERKEIEYVASQIKAFYQQA